MKEPEKSRIRINREDVDFFEKAETLTDFSYTWRYILSETKGTSHFALDKETYMNLKKSIIDNSEKLRLYKKSEDGLELGNSVLEYINNINEFLGAECGRKVL